MKSRVAPSRSTPNRSDSTSAPAPGPLREHALERARRRARARPTSRQCSTDSDAARQPASQSDIRPVAVEASSLGVAAPGRRAASPRGAGRPSPAAAPVDDSPHEQRRRDQRRARRAPCASVGVGPAWVSTRIACGRLRSSSRRSAALKTSRPSSSADASSRQRHDPILGDAQSVDVAPATAAAARDRRRTRRSPAAARAAPSRRCRRRPDVDAEHQRRARVARRQLEHRLRQAGRSRRRRGAQKAGGEARAARRRPDRRRRRRSRAPSDAADRDRAPPTATSRWPADGR